MKTKFIRFSLVQQCWESSSPEGKHTKCSSRNKSDKIALKVYDPFSNIVNIGAGTSAGVYCPVFMCVNSGGGSGIKQITSGLLIEEDVR